MAKKIILILIICLTQLAVFSPAVLAISIGIKPKELFITEKAGKENEAELLITNTGSEPAVYQVYPDSNKKNISVVPENFFLSPQESKIVVLKTKFWLAGNHQTYLSVLSRPVAAGGMSVSGGIKVPLYLEITGMALRYLVIGLIVFVCLGLFIVIKLNKSKQNHENFS